MAQSGYTPLLVYGSSTAAAEPTAPNLTSSANGAELALNYADGKLFYKNSGGNVRLLAIGYGASTVTPTAGGIQYGTGTAVAFTAAGTAGYILQSNGASAPSWVAAPSTSPGGSTTQVQYNNAGAFAGSANFVFDGTNVGIGVTPESMLSVVRAVRVGQGAMLEGRSNSTVLNLSANQYISAAGQRTYITTGEAAYYEQIVGQHRWFTAPSGTAGNAITFTQAMMLDASGNLGIGTSSPATRLDVRGTPGADYGIANIFDTTSAASGVGGVLALSGYKTTTSAAAIFAKIKGIKENATAGNEAGALTFETNSGSAYAERMRITSGGQLIVGTTATGTGANSARIYGYANNSVHNGAAIYGYNASTVYPGVGTTRYGVRGETYGYSSGGPIYGVYGYAVDDAVYNTTQYGVYGESGPAIYSPGYGVYAKATHNPTASQSGYALFANMNTTGAGSTATTYGARIENNSTAGATAFGLYVSSATGATTTVPFAVAVGGSEVMRVNSSGNVGIGTSSPGYRLDVQDAIRIKVDGSNNANLYFNATSTRLYYSDGSGNLSFYTNSTERMIVGYGGGITINYSLGVGTTASGTTGEIRATNNITAYYSDDRLKTRLGSIENALDKVCQLDGFFYEANQTAQDLGYKPVREVGVSAQQVQAVLPEIVVPAPIDEKYLTVRYEKMIPLLVEAIKELRAEVKALRGE